MESFEPIPEERAEMMLSEQDRRAAEDRERERKLRLQSLSATLSEKRKKAVEARRASGIESEWDECDDAYEGVDEFTDSKGTLTKPRSSDGRVRVNRERSTTRSTVFMNITRPYVDAASARVADMLLPTDDRNWGIKPTPIPELEAMLKSEEMIPVPQIPQMGQPNSPMGMPPEMGAPQMGQAPTVQSPTGNGPVGQPSAPSMTPEIGESGEPPEMAPAKDIAQEQLEEAKERADSAQTRIDDWLTECQYHAEVRKGIESAARLGTMVIKGPVPVKKKKRVVKAQGQSMMMTMEQSLSPASKAVDIRNFYPDGACGENIHNGSFVFEKDHWSAKQLKDCAEMPEHLGYLKEEILECLEEGPSKRNLDARNRKDVTDDDRFEVWYFYGDISKEDLESTNCDCKAYSTPTLPVLITMVNDRVIKAAISHLDSGEFPYDVMPWQRRAGHWSGIGVARQMNVAQRMLNAATRAMMDNAGISSGPQIVIDKEAVRPADGTYSLYGGKIWEKLPEATMDDVRKAFMSVTIESRQDQLMAIIQYAMKMAEDMTGLPLLMQGQAQSSTPDSVGGMIILNNNANAVLRRIARTFDDCVTEPHIRRYYEYLMNDPDVPDKEKGDYAIDARGSTALVERAIHDQTIMQMGQYVLNPAFGADPELWFAEAMKAQRMDPKRIMLSEEKKAQMSQQQTPPDPRIESANIRAQTDIQTATLTQQSDMAELQFKAQEAERQRIHEKQIKEAEFQIEMMKLSQAKDMSLDQIRASLAETGLKLRTQKELAITGKAPQVASPPTEPPQHAPNGQAYQQ